VDRARAEEQRLAHALRNGMSVGLRKHGGVVAGHRDQLRMRDLKDLLDRDKPLKGTTALRTAAASPTVRNITSASADGDTTFGASPRR